MPTLDELMRDPYAALGVRKIINATCHTTRVGGTLIPDEVLAAMRAAAGSHVEMHELQRAAGRVIAHYTHAEDGYIVSGCAAALLVGAAAIITGTDPVKAQQLPHLAGTGMKDRAITKRFPRQTAPDGSQFVHYGYAHAVKTTGIQFDEIGNGGPVSRAELAAAFGPQTALVYWGSEQPPGELTVEEVVEVADAHNVPVLVDNSNHLPPKENLWRYTEAGAALVAFSGGKGLQGPQGAGILAGRADLIEAVAMQASPTQGIGRVCKVSKEEVVGQLAALTWWAEQDDDVRLAEQLRQTQKLVALAQGLSGATTTLKSPDRIGRPYPSVYVEPQPESGLTAESLVQQLYDGEPPIAVKGGDEPAHPLAVRFDVRLCEDWEIEAIGRRLHEIFSG